MMLPTRDQGRVTARTIDPRTPGRPRARTGVLLLQLLLVVGAGLLILAPPANGAMMLVPLGPQAANALPILALAGDVRLLARGPLPGSLLVYGSRRAALLLRHGIVTLASPPALCGTTANRA